MSKSIKICTNQLKAYNKDPVDGVVLDQDPDNLSLIKFTIFGPKETPWEDHTMFGYITIPDGYPFIPPVLKFSSKTYHPNIYPDGKVCLSILNSTRDETGYFRESELWSPVIDLRCIFLSIMNLFNEPNLESPADLDSCILYRNDKKKLVSLIRNE
jgi:ubiquitin-protein ligase